jgi:NUMOD4 motif
MTMSVSMTAVETWKAIPGYEGLYEISSLGRVRSLTCRVRGRIRVGRVLKLVPGDYGSVRVQLSKESERRCFHIQTLRRLCA